MLPRSGLLEHAVGEGLGKVMPFFERQYLIDCFYFYQGFRLSLPSPSALRSACDLMRFYPKRKFIAFLGTFSIIVSAGMVFLSFHSFDLKTTILALIFFGIFVFLIFPVIKNQVVDVKNDSIIIYNFGKGFDLGSDDLFEVVKRKRGILSYRFQKGIYRFQISPWGYYNDKLLQERFSNLFGEIDK